MSESTEIAETILHQLGGPGRLRAMLGIKSFQMGPSELSFRFPQRQRSKPNHVEVKLTPRDLYCVTFYRIDGLNSKKLNTIDDVYCEMLKTTIEKEIGLYLSLF